MIVVDCRSSLRPPIEISYRTQVDDMLDDSDRMLPHAASFYWPPIVDVTINARPQDSRDQEDHGAVGGIPSLLSNYDVYVGIPDVKPSQAHRLTRDSPYTDHAGTDTSPMLPH